MSVEAQGFEPQREVSLVDNPAVNFLRKNGYELTPAKVGRSKDVAEGGVSNWPADLEEGFHGVSENMMVGTKTITGRGEESAQHIVQLVVSPNYSGRDCNYAIGFYIDGLHVSGMLDATLADVERQACMVEAEATFEKEPELLPDDELKEWQQNWGWGK